jgi:haloacetate dehalogenase
MFDGFATERVATAGAELLVRRAGDGPPLLLLHGAPQTGAMWDRVAQRLVGEFELVVPDLRGYGGSSKPAASPAGHAWSSFRAMAADQVELMRGLGHERFGLAGHDRGARTAHRLALDHPGVLTRLAILDIVPTLHVFEHLDQAVAASYFHWFFLIQPEPMPERVIAGAPLDWLRHALGALGTGHDAFAPEALAEYEACIQDPAAIHGLCEDYRAAASVDLEHDRADRGRRVDCRTLVLWGARGVVGRSYDVLAVWREHATDVSGRALEAGHYLAEERPEETARELAAFFG